MLTQFGMEYETSDLMTEYSRTITPNILNLEFLKKPGKINPTTSYIH